MMIHFKKFIIKIVKHFKVNMYSQKGKKKLKKKNANGISYLMYLIKKRYLTGNQNANNVINLLIINN
jgi:hypothetical protein